MDAHRIKSLSDGKSKNRLRFATTKQKAKRASADVYRKYKRRIGVTSSATREENVHHHSSNSSQRPSKRSRRDKNESPQGKLSVSPKKENEPNLVDEATTLSTELELSNERNASEIFGQFYRELWPLVRSLPEVIHHSEMIIEIMLRYMLSPEDTPEQKSSAADLFDFEGTQQPKRYQVNLATTEILHLLAVCSKDLRHEIHVWLHSRILPRIFMDMLNPPLASSGKQPIPLDVTIIEAAFRAVAYLLRYDTENLVGESDKGKGHEQPCLEPMRKHYGATLTNKRPLIRQLAAESFAPLIRKLKAESSRKRHLRRILRSLDASAVENPSPAKSKLDADAVEGVALLCFETAKGSAGDMHSKGTFVVDCVLNSVAAQKNKGPSLSCEVASILLPRLLGFLSEPDIMLDNLKAQFVSFANEKDSSLDSRGGSLGSFLRLTTEVLSFNNGETFGDGTARNQIISIVESARDWILKHGQNAMIEEWMTRLLFSSIVSCQIYPQALSSLCDILASFLGVGSVRGMKQVESSSFRLNVARHIFSPLPLELAIVHVAPLLILAAEKVADDSERIALIHGVACHRGDQMSDDDHIFTLELAHRCKIGSETVENLMDGVMFPVREPERNSRLLTVASTCLAFLAACQNDPSRYYMRASQWLVDVVASVLECKSWQTSDDLRLVLSSSIESLARLSLFAFDRSAVDIKKNIKMQLAKAKKYVERIITANPTSINCLRSTALFCQALRCVTEFLTDQIDSIFESLTPSLSCASHFKRLHALEILLTFPKKPFVTDHADLDLSDDLDDEPSSTKAKGQTAKGPVGLCGVLELLLEIESLPIELASERPMLSLMSRVEVLGRSGKLPVIYAEAVTAHLIGLQYWKFSPVWQAAVKTLALIARNHDRYVWPLIFSKLEQLMEHSVDVMSTKDEKHSLPPGFDVDFHVTAFKRYDESDGQCFLPYNDRVRMVNDAGKISKFESRSGSEALGSLWELFANEPSLIVGHSRDMVPLAVRFFRFEYFSKGDPDAEEIFEHQVLDPSIATYKGEPGSRGVVRGNLASVLKAFSVVKGPEQLFLHSKLHQICFALLGHFEPDMAKLAFECVLRFKPEYAMPYADEIRDLFAKGKLRDTMIRLKEYSNNGKITPDHRVQLGPLLARILMGRMSAKSVGKSTKDSPSARRAAIFSFVSGFCEQDTELFPFLFLPLRRYLPGEVKKSRSEDPKAFGPAEFKAALTRVSVQDCRLLPSVVHEGSLNVLEVIISQLGHRVIDFVPSFMCIVLTLLEQFSLKHDDHNDCQHQHQHQHHYNEEHSMSTEIGRPPERAGKLRSLCFLRLAEILKKFTAFDFSSYSERMWKVLHQPVLSLPQLAKSADKAPALLKMLQVMSSQIHQREILCKQSNCIEQIFCCLSKSDSFSVMDTLLSLVENLVDNAVEEHTSTANAAVIEHIPTLLKHFEIRLETFGTTITWKRELSILARVCDLSKQKNSTDLSSRELDSLTSLLLPFLDYKSKSSDRDRINILEIIESIIPNIQTDTGTSLFTTLSSLLGPYKSGAGCSDLALRAKVASSLWTLSDCHLPQTKGICEVAKDLCAVNTKVIDEADAETILTSLKDLSTHQGTKSWITLLKGAGRRRYLLPVVRACFHLLYVEDGVIARGAFYALKDLLQEAPKMDDTLREEAVSWEKFLEQQVVPAIRSGISCKTATARRFFVLLAAEACKVCKTTESPYLMGDLSPLLCEEDPDLDFFQNITHVQLHRRTRGLNRLRRQFLQENSESCQFSLQSIASILVPIALHPIYESKTKLEEPLAMEAIATLAALGRRLPWKKYHDEICTLLAQVDRQAQQERYIIGAICGLLSSFHFDIGNPYSAESTSVSRTAVWNGLEKRIIPRLEALFTKEKVGKSGDKIRMVRPQVILALTELYTNLPPEILRSKLSRMLTVVCDAMKCRESDARDLARTTLSKLSVKVGLRYLPDIVRELAVTLREGYQLHVRAAALHSILLEISESTRLLEGSEKVAAPSVFDASISGIVDLIQQDLFGTAQARKDAELNQVRYVKEAGGSKSLHSLELVASLVTIGPNGDQEGQSSPVHAVVSPLLNRMRLESHNSKQLRHLRECLQRVVQGMSKNTTFSARTTLPLIYATIEPCLSKDPSSKTAGEAVPGRNSKGSVVEWRPSAAEKSDSALEARQNQKHMENQMRKVVDGSDAPKYTGSERQSTVGSSDQSLDEPSSVAAVIFGLQLLRHALKQGEFEEDEKGYLEPFVSLLTTCVCYCRDSEAVLLALRCLVEIHARCKEFVPVGSSFRLLATKTLDLLVGYGGNEDLLQASFKMMTFLVERGFESGAGETESKVLDEEQMELLLSFLQTSISTTNQHNPTVMLIKALVRKRIVSAGMYDLMKVLLDQSVKSFKENLRRAACGIYLQFLMDYPMTEERMEREIKHLVSNIQYEGVEGRQSAIGMVTSVIKKFPEEVVAKHASVIFVALTMQLGNEESDRGRVAVSESLAALLAKLPSNSLGSLFDYAMRWAEGGDLRLRRVSLSVLGLFIDSSDIVRREDNCKAVLSVAKEGVSSQESWELTYFSLRVLEKLHSRWPEKVVSDFELWPNIVKGLDGSHPWVTRVSLRVLSQHLQLLDPTNFVERDQATFLQERGLLFELTKALCATLDSPSSDDIELIVKMLTWTLKAIHKNPHLCSTEEADGTDSRNPVRWLMTRLSKAAKPKEAKQREAVFKCFAAFATYAEDIAMDYLELMIEPIYRVERESAHKIDAVAERTNTPAAKNDEVIQLSKDLLHLLEQVCVPHEKFVNAYGAVKRRAQDQKSKRQDHLVAEAARDPKSAAERKQKKQDREKKRRKKRIDERRQSQGRVAKRRHL